MELIKQAIEFHKTGNFLEAEKYYLQFLKEKPNEAKAHHLLGLLYFQNKEFNQAVLSFKNAIKLEKSPEFYTNLGLSYFELEDYKSAISALKKAFIAENSALICEKIILCARALNLHKDFIKYSIKFLELTGEDPDLMLEIARTSLYQWDYKTSLKYAKKLLKFIPENPSVHNIMALSYEAFVDYKKAKETYEFALLFSRDPSLKYNYAGLLKGLGQYDEAEEIYESLIRRETSLSKSAKCALGLSRLHKKDFETGFKYYVEFLKESHNKIFPKKWDGKKDPALALAFCATEGFGDIIMYSRYLDLINPSDFKMVTIAVPVELYDLFKFNFPMFQIKKLGEPAMCGAGALLIELPIFCNADFNHIPSPEKYLMAPPEAVSKFEEKFDKNKLNVGIFFACKPNDERIISKRNIPIKYVAEILKLENINFYSIQPEKKFTPFLKKTSAINLSSDIKNFSDTAGIIQNLDVVVTIDSSVAHLAGALGKKTLLMLPKAAEWRWFDSDDKCDWYESVQIIKQADYGDWESVVERVRAELQVLNNEKLGNKC